MSDLLSIIQETANPDPESIAKLLGRSHEEIKAEIQTLKENGSLLGWVPLLNPQKNDDGEVKSVIEVKISPEREGDLIVWLIEFPSLKKWKPVT